MQKVALVVAVLAIGVPQWAWAACGYDAVSVSGTSEEAADACRALAEVLSYFEKIGLQPNPSVSISFENQAYIEVFQQTHELRKESVGKSPVSGYYDFRRMELHITSGRREVPRERKPWGIEWDRPIAYSILQHELVHAVVASLLGNGYQQLAKEWHEVIAYAVQFHVMEDGVRRRVLANYPGAKPFQFPENVNPVVYAADPDEFGVSAYLFTEANGGPRFVAELLAKKVPFSTREFEFLWLE